MFASPLLFFLVPLVPLPQVGWKYGAVVSVLEEKRKARSEAYFKAKQSIIAAKAKAVAANADAIKQHTEYLASVGY